MSFVIVLFLLLNKLYKTERQRNCSTCGFSRRRSNTPNEGYTQRWLTVLSTTHDTSFDKDIANEESSNSSKMVNKVVVVLF